MTTRSGRVSRRPRAADEKIPSPVMSICVVCGVDIKESESSILPDDVAEIIMPALSPALQETLPNVKVKVLCPKCSVLCNQYEMMQRQMNMLKSQLTTKSNTTAEKLITTSDISPNKSKPSPTKGSSSNNKQSGPAKNQSKIVIRDTDYDYDEMDYEEHLEEIILEEENNGEEYVEDQQVNDDPDTVYYEEFEQEDGGLDEGETFLLKYLIPANELFTVF